MPVLDDRNCCTNPKCDHATPEMVKAAFPRPGAPYVEKWFANREALRNGTYDWYVPSTRRDVIYDLRETAKEMLEAADNLEKLEKNDA